MKNHIKINRVIKGFSQETLTRAVGVTRQTINALAAKYVPSTVLSIKAGSCQGCRTISSIDSL